MPRLPKYDFSLPGGYKYEQPETGMQFDGNTPWRAQLRQIQRHRQGNNLPRQSLEEVADDLESFTCARLPKLCVNGGRSPTMGINQFRQVRTGGCGSCGGRKK